jgi:arginyl-tRNA synthetase
MSNYEVFKKEIADLIVEYLQTQHSQNVEFDAIYNNISTPPDFALGQAAFPCFPLAKTFKKPPQNIAQEIADYIGNKEKKFIAAVSIVNAYLNFECNFDSLLNFNLNKNIDKNALSPKKIDHIIVEYSQPNTHKILHVGHLRCLVLGDAVSNILEYVGHKVVRATYPGDIGTHVAKVIWYLTHPEKKQLPAHNKAQWLGEKYAEADRAFKAPQTEQEKAEIKRDIGDILRQLSDGKGEYYTLWKETRQWSLDYLKSVYEWLNCKFDTWFFESDFEQSSKEFVLQKYKEGVFVKDNGAIGIDLSEHNLGFVMYLKSDGNGLYITKDLLLLFKKFSDPTITKSIYVVDARQKRHFEQLFKTAELLKISQASQSFHLSYETVNTETGEPFSSRALQGFELYELRDKMEAKILHDYLERYRGDWDDVEIASVAQNVCIGALKYGLLRTDNNTQINFSLSDWLKLDGDTGPYLQYAYARCCSILAKTANSTDISESVALTVDAEKKLLFFIHRFPEFCLQSAQNLKPSTLAHYLHDLVKIFNYFYETCSIIKSEPVTKNTRIALVKLTRQTLHKGLELLGIKCPQRM